MTDKRQIEGTVKDFIFQVESYLAYDADNDTFTKKELLSILVEVAKEQFGVELLTKQEKQKLLHAMYEQGKFDAIALLTNGSMQSKVESSMRDLLDKIDSYLAKGEDYCGSLGAGLLAAKMIIALYCKEHNLEVE